MTSLPQLIDHLRRRAPRQQPTNDIAKSTPQALPSSPPSPSLRSAAPIPSSPTPPTTLPHLIDLDPEHPSVPHHRHNPLFWNSTLEQRGSEPVPERDALGKLGAGGRTYWVKDFPTKLRVPRRERGDDDGVSERDFARGAQRGRGEGKRVEKGDEEGGDDDLYAAPTPAPKSIPTPKWPRRMDSLGARVWGVGKKRDGSEGVGKGKARVMRGGGERVVQPFEFGLAPSVLESIEVAARADPLRNGVLRGTYVARPSVVHGEVEGESGGKELGEARMGAGQGDCEKEVVEKEESDSLREYLHAVWDPNAQRSSTAELESAYGRYEEDEGGLDSGVDEKEVWVGRGPTPDISQHPAFRNDARAQEKEGERNGVQVPTNLETCGTVSSSPPLINGIDPETSPGNPPSAHHPPPEERAHSPSSVPSSLLRSLPSPPSSHTTDPDLEEYLLSANLLPPFSEHTLPAYRRTLAAQAKSIHDLHSRITHLTSVADYYKDTLLPQAFTHWTTVARENRSLTTAIRGLEQENALLWDVLGFSHRLLDLCWERDCAVVETVKTMRARKMRRANCAVLERLVGRGGPGRGGEVEGRRKGRWAWGRTESPYREDLEQLGFVCEQNLRVLGEDLGDWNIAVARVIEGKGEGQGEEGEEERGSREA